jgi:phosphoribosylformimino-5-aminoimidazole carboxamide ribotide isomerase
VIDLYPAIDIRGGRVVRLRQGDYDDETMYGDDPVEVAESYAADGASWIHLVDLDAARSGRPVNRAVIARVAAAVADRAFLQVGGGVRSLDDIREVRDLGVARAVIGSAAVRDPALVESAAELLPVAVGLDHRGGELAVHGWTEGSGLSLTDALGRYPAAAALVITDIARDGMLAGPDVDGLRRAASGTDVPVVASGGVASLDDLAALAAIPGLVGVIAGKALYERRFTVAEAIQVLRR